MDMRTMKREPANPEQSYISTDESYRGFRIKMNYRETEYSKEVAGCNVNGDRLIGSGDTLDEAYDKLVERIDRTLDG